MPASFPSRRILLDSCTTLAREAGREIMRIYGGDVAVRDKMDRSPVTDADQAAEAVIIAGLRRLTPDAVVIAEEEVAAGRVPALDGAPFWLVDPLDGTKEFISKNGEFTVNIALVEDGRPTLGIVFAPAIDTLWRGAAGFGAEKGVGGGEYAAIRTRKPPPQGLTVCVSRSHAVQSDLDAWFRDNGLMVTEQVDAGSSLKFCLIAEGKADVYPRLGPTREWDTAAAHCVLEAAGGEVVAVDGRALVYGHPPFLNPHFVARTAALRPASAAGV